MQRSHKSIKVWKLKIWIEKKVLTATNEDVSRWSLPQQTFIWALQQRPDTCLYVLSSQDGCSGFEPVVLFSLCTGVAVAKFDGWLNTKTLLGRSRETASHLFVKSGLDWQRWMDRWSFRPQQSWKLEQKCWVMRDCSQSTTKLWRKLKTWSYKNLPSFQNVLKKLSGCASVCNPCWTPQEHA